jgi:hypothetical protein
MRILLLKAGFLNKLRPNVSVVYELAVQAANREGLLLAELPRTQLSQEVASSQPPTASYRLNPELHEILI